MIHSTSVNRTCSSPQPGSGRMVDRQVITVNLVVSGSCTSSESSPTSLGEVAHSSDPKGGDSITRMDLRPIDVRTVRQRRPSSLLAIPFAFGVVHGRPA
jgi:hypothetical protein